ncbi:hypothetical protein MCUN1_002817 [Malassezia cuniculi]|uniref:ABC1 atypical kinase-like domain-containing protein n=1 Tax=Malassezia cuniculi TaxID=948313 RepID=A0AAF0ESH3_9BASI|nr:hypothetical protein MCUN1_002817 [Malassezia cuniculi]
MRLPSSVGIARPVVASRMLSTAVPPTQKSRFGYKLGGAVALSVGAACVGWTVLSADAPPSNDRKIDWTSPESLLTELKRGVAESSATQTAQFMVLAVSRSTTIAKAVILCMLDYRRVLNARYSSREDEEEALRLCHLRSAQRILVALQTNGGVYIKLGQHLSSVILLPREWTATMRPLQDQNAPTPIPELEAMFQAETGMTFDEAFSEFDPVPLGVASLAQVHRARDRKTGQMLAIKMLHPDVERFSEVDMQMVTVLVRWVKRVFPEFSFEWLADEMNRNLPLELDFRHEAGNSARAQRDFAQYKKTSVAFPKVPWVHKRVMAMEFIEGQRPDNLAYLAKHNIDRNHVSQELSKIFAQMLYLHGFFHADPHGGNVMIRPRQPDSRSPYNFEIVLLDHGLYFEIDEELRVNYAKFWLSLLMPSTPKVQAMRRKYAKLVGNIGDDLYPILESAITGRSGLEGSDPENPNGVKGRRRASSLLDSQKESSALTSDEVEHIRKTVMEKEGLFVSVLDLLRNVPRAMLMVLKINDLTRALDANLHTTHGPIRPFIITARYCALAAHNYDKRELSERWSKHGFSLRLVGDYLGSWWTYIYFYRGLMFLEGLSDLKASVRITLAYWRALFVHRFNREAAHRAAAGIDAQEESNRLEEQERVRAVASLEGESADLVAA